MIFFEYSDEQTHRAHNSWLRLFSLVMKSRRRLVAIMKIPIPCGQKNSANAISIL